jgi:hypothetical protein
MSATSPSEAKAVLQASLQAPMPAPISLAGLGALARPEHHAWNRWLVILAACFGAAALAFAYSTSLATIVLVPSIATMGVWAALQLSPSTPDVVVWAEAESGAQVARSRAWQRFVGPVRSDARLPLLPQLGSARACDPRREVRMNFDAARGLATFAEVDARLLQPVALCYEGYVPVVRAVAIDARPDGVLAVRNAGTQAWPPGRLLAGRRVHELPALAPGETASIATEHGKPATDPAVRTALSRTPAEGEAVLWKLALAGGASEAAETNAWLLVSIPRR